MKHARLASCLAIAIMSVGPNARANPPAPAGKAEASVPQSATAMDWKRINDRIFNAPATDLKSLATRAYVWGMPLVEAAHIRARFSAPRGDSPGTPLNRFVHNRTLADPESRIGVGLNNDTIYSLAWVDLNDGPIIVTTPDFGERHYTFSINLADTSANQSVGQRTHGGQLPSLFIHGPNYESPVPEGMIDVPSTTRYVNVAGRMLVVSPDEYRVVHRLQDRITLRSWTNWHAGRRKLPEARFSRPLADPSRQAPADLAFLDTLNRVLQDWMILPRDEPVIRSLEPLGIAPDRRFDANRFSPTDRIRIAAGLAEGRRLAQARSLQLGVQRNGWTINYAGPRFGDDYLLRAGVAKDQPYVAIPEEAIYPVGRIDAAVRPLNGRHSYRIRFAPGKPPPVGAFWSVTAYDDRGYMIPNPANRYSIGNRTAELVRDADMGLTIYLSVEPPAHGPARNWLPVARDAPFYLMMRLYQPDEGILRQRWFPPAIERID